MCPKTIKTMDGLIGVKTLPLTHFINYISTEKYRKAQDKIVNFLKVRGFQEVHLPFFIPKKFLKPINVSNNIFITTFSGKDKRTVFFLRPFWGFLSGIPFVSNNISSYKQLPLFLIERGPLYGNFPQEWKLLYGGKEDYLGLHGVLITTEENSTSLVDIMNNLFNHLGVTPTRRKREDFLKTETVSFYHQKIFICACFNLKTLMGEKFEIHYNTRQQKQNPIFWQSFYLSQNLFSFLI